jgi:hypothetical protein
MNLNGCSNKHSCGVSVILEIVSDIKEPLENSTEGECSNLGEEQKYSVCLSLTEELLQHTRKVSVTFSLTSIRIHFPTQTLSSPSKFLF